MCVEHPCGDAAEAITATERGGSWHVSASDLFSKKDLCRKIDLKMSKGHRQQRAGGGGEVVVTENKNSLHPSFTVESGVGVAVFYFLGSLRPYISEFETATPNI